MADFNGAGSMGFGGGSSNPFEFMSPSDMIANVLGTPSEIANAGTVGGSIGGNGRSGVPTAPLGGTSPLVAGPSTPPVTIPSNNPNIIKPPSTSASVTPSTSTPGPGQTSASSAGITGPSQPVDEMKPGTNLPDLSAGLAPSRGMGLPPVDPNRDVIAKKIADLQANPGKPAWWQYLLGGAASFGSGMGGKTNGPAIFKDIAASARSKTDAQAEALQTQLAAIDKTHADQMTQYKDFTAGVKENEQMGMEKDRLALQRTEAENTPTGQPYQKADGKWYTNTKAGKEIPTGEPARDQSSAETARHNRAEEGLQANEPAGQPYTRTGPDGKDHNYIMTRGGKEKEIKGETVTQQGQTRSAIKAAQAAKTKAQSDSDKQYQKETSTLGFMPPNVRGPMQQKADADKRAREQKINDDYNSAVGQAQGNPAYMQGAGQSFVSGVSGQTSPTAANRSQPNGQSNASASATPQHKVGDVVSVRGQQIKITQITPDGKFSGVKVGQ